VRKREIAKKLRNLERAVEGNDLHDNDESERKKTVHWPTSTQEKKHCFAQLTATKLNRMKALIAFK
jgi:protein required for attachment to host cells